MVLPSAGTYQVKALVNDTSLDDCSLINKGDEIYPYFASSVANDPDITGLMVFLQNSQGTSLGGKVLYSLNSGKNVSSETEWQYDEKGNITIPVKRLDKDLPKFPMPDYLEIGQYRLVFQILGSGEKETLYRTEKAIYYLGNAEFFLKEIQIYLPDVSADSRLVPPGAAVMLEARLDFDPRLDPYIMWYNGKNLISQGSLRDGAGSFLWKAPDQTGFHSLRAEAFPFEYREGIAGSSREISIPISAKAAGGDLVSGNASNLLHWYQFAGNLQDSKSPVSSEWALVPQAEKTPRWTPAGYSYGLSVGPNDVYLLPAVSIQNGENTGGQFLLRFKPVSDGSIFSARFGSSPNPLEMNLRLSGEDLVLSLSAAGASVIEEISTPVLEYDEYITASIDFSILSGRFEAEFNPAYSAEPETHFDDMVNYVKSVNIAVSVAGEYSLMFGAELSEEKSTEAEAAQTTAIWDEFAILY